MCSLYYNVKKDNEIKEEGVLPALCSRRGNVTLALCIFLILILKSIQFLKLKSIHFLMLAVARGIKTCEVWCFVSIIFS